MRHFLCCADVVIIALMVHSPLKKTRKGTRDGRKKMQIFSYVFRLQKTEATSSISRNKIALCACWAHPDGCTDRLQEGGEVWLKGRFLEPFCKPPCCYKVLGCLTVPCKWPLKYSSASSYAAAELCSSSSRAAVPTQPLRAHGQSPAIVGQHPNGDPQAGGMQIKHQHVTLSGEPALAQHFGLAFGLHVLGSASFFCWDRW